MHNYRRRFACFSTMYMENHLSRRDDRGNQREGADAAGFLAVTHLPDNLGDEPIDMLVLESEG